jgi:glyoxylase-like metal-dependent hydrolase (beta-lactamase superfamily II)
MADQQRLQIVQIPAGPIETNAFLVCDPESADAFVVDAPPDLLAALEVEVEQRGATPRALLLTHTHWDHIGDTAAVSERYGIPVMVHDLDRARLEDPSDGPVPMEPKKPDRLLAEGDELTLGRHRFEVMHTPGHSPGQVSFYCAEQKILLGGDTLFPDGYGRVDIAGASEEQTVATMRRLLELPDDVTVLTGHGRPTTIGRERPWMERVAESGQLL